MAEEVKEKVAKLIHFPKELADEVSEVQKELIIENMKNDVEDFNVSFTALTLELIELGLKAKKRQLQRKK